MDPTPPPNRPHDGAIIAGASSGRKPEADPGSRSGNRRPARRAVRLVVWLLPLLVLFAAIPRLLSRSAPPPERADAIYVFPGQVPDRALCAARLYEEGRGPLVVLSGSSVRPELEAVGTPLTDAALNARIAVEAGVPANATVVLPEGTSTWEDVGVLAAWMEAHGARSVIAITSAAHARRASWSLWFALRGLPAESALAPCGPEYGFLWWTQERSLVHITSEVLKLGFYAIRYFLPSAFYLIEPPGGASRA